MLLFFLIVSISYHFQYSTIYLYLNISIYISEISISLVIMYQLLSKTTTYLENELLLKQIEIGVVFLTVFYTIHHDVDTKGFCTIVTGVFVK